MKPALTRLAPKHITMKEVQKIKDLPAILFPHTHLSEAMVKKILSFFGPITIFRPWFMDRPVLSTITDQPNAIQVKHPPSSLKPGEDFMSRLTEYRHWIEYNQDRGYTEFLQANQENMLTENTTWEIRQMIRREGRQNSAPQENPALKWHLILHLAQDVEDQKLEADKALKALKEKDVPLKGIVEESVEMNNLWEDLPSFKSEPIWGESRLRQILKAWLALFEGYLNENHLLVTSSRHVMAYVTDLWKETQIEDQGEGLTSICFKFPDLSHRSLRDLAEIKKTRLNDGKIRKLKASILDLNKNAHTHLPGLEALAKEVEASCPWEISQGVLNMRVTCLAPITASDQGLMDPILKGLKNRTLVLVEDKSDHE